MQKQNKRIVFMHFTLNLYEEALKSQKKFCPFACGFTLVRIYSESCNIRSPYR